MPLTLNVGMSRKLGQPDYGIDTLKAIKDGSVSLDAALNGSPT